MAATANSIPAPSRRAFFGSAVAAGALAALPITVATSPDAHLFALVVRFMDADRAAIAACDAFDAASDACNASEPPRPDAMRRTKDFPLLFGDARNRSSPEFYTHQECERFRGDYLSPGRNPPGTTSYERRSRRERVSEIVAAFDGWRAKRDANEAAHGLPEAEERETAALEARRRLAIEIRDLRPTSLAGLIAKATVWELYDENHSFSDAMRADLLAMGGAA